MTPDVAHELRRTVRSDLQHLADTWVDEVDDDWLRRESAYFRRLLIGDRMGDVLRLWKAERRKGEPRLLGATLAALDASDVDFATADPVRTRWGTTFSAIAYTSIREDRPPLPGPQLMPLSRYLDGVPLIAGGTKVRRRDLVKYVANKLGGAHLDERRDPARDAAFIALDQIRGASVMDRQATFGQLLAMGQALVGSEDVQDLTKVRPPPRP